MSYATMHGPTPVRHTSPAMRVLGLIMAAGTLVGLIIVGMWGLTPHPAQQKEISVKVISAVFDVGDYHYQDIVVQDKAGDSFTIFGWNDNIWQDGHNSTVVEGQDVQVWAITGTDSFEGYHIVAVAQNPWPHDYNAGRIIVLALLCFVGAFFFFPGLNLLFRR